MVATILGLVLDSSVVIAAERRQESVPDFIEGLLRAHGPLELSLSPVTVAELVHGIFRASTQAASERRRLYIEELLSLIPVHPVTRQTGWLVGQIQGQEAAKGNVLPFSDLMIAATAIEQGYAVLTGNVRHFQKIPSLQVLSSL
jgi:tRNA(fMet)-specific endonuclease VapC